ncbi:MAG: Maf family nucleotide pyrophosphatase [Bacteroidales bacterium]|nr:Maf family nucleotide pyrophosphatase [Bacteroidales bacterium]MDD3988486.1 Maf family nucleotide pyrophosphatase [Bacteroidales bacterium]
MANKLFSRFRIILLSSSPRRIMLLKGADIDFTVETNHGSDESFDPLMDASLVPEFLARQKSLSYNRNLTSDEILITADTIVVCSGEILGKPSSREEATEILGKLSGKRHTVYTGVCLRDNLREKLFTSSTEVFFKRLTMEEIDYYVDNYNPYDKAGAYGAQDWIGLVAIEKIEGSYFNVMGLPIEMLYTELYKFLSDKPV